MRSLTSLPNDEYRKAVEALAQELDTSPVRGHIVMWKGEQFRLNRKAVANIHQAHADQAPDPLPSFSGGECQYPHFFDTDACCICGDLDVNACPCTSRDTLVHRERQHPGHDSDLLREHLGCLLVESEPAPNVPGMGYQGMFQAPCGDTIAYITEMGFPTLAHYRWHGIYDHLTQGNCADEDKCDEALWSGEV